MKVGVPTEIKTDEYRVALTPAGVRELVEHGHEVAIQAGAGEGSAISRRRVHVPGRVDPARRGRGVRVVRHDRQGQGAAGGRGRDARAAPHALHLPAPRAGPRAHARAGRVGRDLRRLRDRRGRARAAAAAGADERGRGQDRHPGGRVHAREAARRARDPARRRAGRGGGEGDDHRRRRGRHERGVHRARDGGHGLRLRPQHRPPARARHRLRRARRHVLRVDAGHRAAPARGRPRDRRGARARGEGAVRDPARAARADEAPGGARGRLDRPGRLLRDVAADDALRPDLRGRRRPALLRGQHAGRGAGHLDARADQRDAAVRAARRRRGRRAGARARTRAWPRASTSSPARSPTSRWRRRPASRTPSCSRRWR